MSEISRREFLKRSGAAAAIIAPTIVPSSVLGKAAGKTAPSDKLNIAAVGIGGMGHSNINAVKGTENIVALCDTDWNYAKGVFDEFPNAKRYWDYRVMFDEMAKDIDAVIVATADHTHCIIAAEAMTLGKHVYVQKPLTHSVYESRLLTKLAASTGVVTQMGNQGSSADGTATACDWVWNGEIGDVTKVECATDRPIWPQGLNIPPTDKVPKTLNWDLFTGPAKLNPYSKIYQPWNWRGWWDYGTGALGDMACHIMHTPFKALKLGYPTKVEASSTLLLTACAPNAQHVKLIFPARENMPKVAFPEVEVHWYDGGMMPERPAGFPQGKSLMGEGGGLIIMHGTKDTLISNCYGHKPWLLSGRVPKAPQVARRVKLSHEMDWVRACKENKASRVKTNSDFSEAGPFNEMVVMGVLAVRLQALNKVLEWDGENMRFTNIGENETIKTCIKDGFTINNGHPTFAKDWTDAVNAREYAAELVKHTYRTGWKLPDMPK